MPEKTSLTTRVTNELAQLCPSNSLIARGLQELNGGGRLSDITEPKRRRLPNHLRMYALMLRAHLNLQLRRIASFRLGSPSLNAAAPFDRAQFQERTQLVSRMQERLAQSIELKQEAEEVRASGLDLSRDISQKIQRMLMELLEDSKTSEADEDALNGRDLWKELDEHFDKEIKETREELNRAAAIGTAEGD